MTTEEKRSLVDAAELVVSLIEADAERFAVDSVNCAILADALLLASPLCSELERLHINGPKLEEATT